MTDADLAEWRAAGLAAGDLYGDELALLVQDRNASEAGLQGLIEALGGKLQEEARRFREGDTPEELIAEYTRAAVEAVMVRMHAIRLSTPAGGTEP